MPMAPVPFNIWYSIPGFITSKLSNAKATIIATVPYQPIISSIIFMS